MLTMPFTNPQPPTRNYKHYHLCLISQILPMSYEQPFRPPPFRHTPYRPWPRPTAPVRRNPHPGTLPACAPVPGHCYGSHSGDDGGRGETSFYRAVAPTGTGGSALILNSEFLILNWTYTFSAKEKDAETGLSYFGSRYYSSDLSIWLSVDPMSDKYPSLSPYVYCADNPVKLVDPNGEEFWKPDEDGNLIAQHGDNAWTLAKYLNIDATDACDMLKSQGYKINNGILNLKVGDKFKVDNVYTRSIANSTSDLTRETDLAHTSKTGATPEDHYNCWGAAVAGSQGKEINNTVGIPIGGEFDYQVYSNYTATNLENAKFGKTLIRFADGNNNAKHAAIYYGTSNDGVVYVYTKNGWDYKPAIMRLNDLLQKFPNYGTIQGINSGDSGYYDFSN